MGQNIGCICSEKYILAWAGGVGAGKAQVSEDTIQEVVAKFGGWMTEAEIRERLEDARHGCVCESVFWPFCCNNALDKPQVKAKAPKTLSHSKECIEANERGLDYELYDRIAWFTQKTHCSGSGYSHKAHGACSGYTYDRT